MTRPFCGACTRARLSAEGKLYTCLFATEGFDFRHLLRSGASDDALSAAIGSVWGRREDRYSELRSGNTPRDAAHRDVLHRRIVRAPLVPSAHRNGTPA